MTRNLPLVLASASPRRRQIISQLGLPFTPSVSPANEEAAQESYQGPVEGLAQWIAAYKGLMMLTQANLANHLIISADTTVILDGRVLGKPQDQQHAYELLLSLRGRWHTVITGVVVSALIDDKLQVYGASCSTPVLMRPYSEEEIEAYIASGDPMDKAGAYGIQHPHFQPTECIQGCYLNVVGLPLCTLVELLTKFDVYPTTEGYRDSACPWSRQCSR
jgi:septum formation protein